MIKGKIKFRGGKKLARNMKKLGGVVSNRIGNKALTAGAQPMITEAKSRAPFDSSIDDGVHIRENISSMVIPDARSHFPFDNAVVIRPFGVDVYYWKFNEIGGLRTPATRFLTKSFDSQKRATVRAILASLKRDVQAEINKL